MELYNYFRSSASWRVRIALALKIGPATVSRILRRLGLNRIRDIEPQPPIVRYEHEAPGDMLHLDIKRLVRTQRPSHRVTGDRRDGVKGIGAEFLHIAIDDHTRLAFAALLPDQKHSSALLFLHMARAFYSRFGFSVRRILTDNGPCYRDKRFAEVIQKICLKHRFTRPYTPRTNGKAERFIQTALREWAYARTYQNSSERHTELDLWIHDYNFHRPHASLNSNPPASRADLNRNNLLSLHT